MDIIKGRVVYKLGDDMNTDKILAGRYLVLTGDDELAEHCFEGHIKDWNEKVQKGDILVARENFGCGSSREHAPVALKGSGIAAVIAETFGRIFYRKLHCCRAARDYRFWHIKKGGRGRCSGD